MRIGDTYDGWTLTAIGRDNATLATQDRTAFLEIRKRNANVTPQVGTQNSPENPAPIEVPLLIAPLPEFRQ